MIKHPALCIALTIISSVCANAQNQVRFSDIKAGMVDPYLEKQALNIANERATDLHWLAEYKKATIISKKWQPIINTNGILTGREIHMELYCVEQNGNCEIADFTFRQKYKDGEYSTHLFCTKVGQLYNIDCE